MAIATKTAAGLEVACPNCGEQGVITIDLNDFNDIHCCECDWCGGPLKAIQLIKEKVEAWERVLRWLDLASTV